MEQSTRICIRVTSPEVFKRIKINEDEPLGWVDFEWLSCQTNCELYETGGCCDELGLRDLVGLISKAIGKDGIVIADTCCIDVDEYNYCVFYLGECFRSEMFAFDDESEESLSDTRFKMHWKTEVNDIAGWLKYGAFELSPEETRILKSVGVEV